MKRLLGFVGILGPLVLGGVDVAFSGTVTVSGTTTVFMTIQLGVNACPEGGTVSVSTGTYTETIYINKRIALIGVYAPIITATGPEATNTVTFVGNNTNNAVISGFMITGATGTGTTGNGIYCKNNATPNITNNTISGNNNAGISCNSSSPIVINNTISGNNGYGIQCSSSSSPSITNNILTGNIDDGIHCSSSFPTITNNTISGNGNHGIWFGYHSSPIITNNIITENGTTNAGYYGIYRASGTPTINYNDIWGNGSEDSNNYSGCSAGPKDISFNPQFIGGGDYHLQPTSPCIDKGTNTAPSIPTTDKDSNPRIVNGMVDMGAYEYQNAYQPLIITIATQTTLGTVSSPPVPGAEITYIITYENIGTVAIQSLSIMDKPDIHTEYVSGSLRMGTTGSTYETANGKTDTIDNDKAAWDGGIVMFDIGNVPPEGPNNSGRVYFRVRIR